MALEKSDCVRDYVMCVFCFFTVFCDKILDPNYEKANFYFVSCSEEEDQGVLESEEEEEEMDSDSSVAVGGYFFFTLPKSSPLISNFEYIEISIYNTQYMKYIFMFVNDYLSLENLSTIDFMLMIQIFIRIIIMFVQLLVALLLYLILSLPLFLPLPLLLLPLQLFLALPVSLLHVVVLLVPLPLLSPQLYVVVRVVVLFYRFFCGTCQGSGRGCVEGPQFHLQHFQIFSNANAAHQ